MSESSLLSQFDKWKKEHYQHGRMAFSRFIMLTFLDGLEKVSDDFIFKGGNLLWHYIQTPRATVDLDLSTITLKSHLEIKTHIEQSFAFHKEIQFSIKEFKGIQDEDEIGAAITIAYQTNHGQKNQFEIDIVYTLPTDLVKIKSTVSGRSLTSASIENIITDKVSAAHRFAGGNTRMKDFDDLWRISKSSLSINKSKSKKTSISNLRIKCSYTKTMILKL